MHLQFTAVKNKKMQYYTWFSTSLTKHHYIVPTTTEKMKFKGTYQSLEFSVFILLQQMPLR